MSVILDTQTIEPPLEARCRAGQWTEGRQLGAAMRALPLGGSLTCNRRARSAKRLIYSMRNAEGLAMVHEFLVLDLADRPGWCRVWRLNPNAAARDDDTVPMFPEESADPAPEDAGRDRGGMPDEDLL